MEPLGPSLGGSPPDLGPFKLNIDGNARGNPGWLGIGGINRDSTGTGSPLLYFSGPSGIRWVNEAELLALRMAFAKLFG